MWTDHFWGVSIANYSLSNNKSDINRMSGDGDDLESICSNNGIPANLFSAIVTTGWSVSTIAMGFSDASEFDQEATLRDLGIIGTCSSQGSVGSVQADIPGQSNPIP